MNTFFTKLAFTNSVKEVQGFFGSRNNYGRIERSGDGYELTMSEVDFIDPMDSFYMGTIGENGWPYVQYRGGPKGFLKVIDSTTLGMANYRGNCQYISVGNTNVTKNISLFFMNYPVRSRLKIWANSEIVKVDQHPELLEKLRAPDYKAIIERVILFKVEAFDWNCPQHFTPKFTAEEI